jgi:hypothetical protein
MYEFLHGHARKHGEECLKPLTYRAKHLVFVPDDARHQDDNGVTGHFFMLKQVCWEDPILGTVSMNACGSIISLCRNSDCFDVRCVILHLVGFIALKVKSDML